MHDNLHAPMIDYCQLTVNMQKLHNRAFCSNDSSISIRSTNHHLHTQSCHMLASDDLYGSTNITTYTHINDAGWRQDRVNARERMFSIQHDHIQFTSRVYKHKHRHKEARRLNIMSLLCLSIIIIVRLLWWCSVCIVCFSDKTCACALPTV